MNLVTGATGILGSHVVLRLLQEGKPVIACRRKNSDIKKTERLFAYYNLRDLFDKIQWREADVCDIFSLEEAFEGISTVYHCAGFVSFCKKNRASLIKINETGTSNVVNACLNKNVKALCHVSSIAAINNHDFKEHLHEGVFWKRNGSESDYALSKYNAEREVWRAMEEGLNALIVNPGVILSPGFWNQSSSRLFSVSYKGNLFYTNGKTGYISARDAAAAMITLTEKKQFSNRYILVEGNYDSREILDHIAGQFGKTKAKIHAGKFLLHTARFFDFIFSGIKGREQVLTKFMIASVLSRQTYLNEKVKKVLQHNFTPVNEEITEICRLYLAESGKKGNNKL